MSPARRSEQRRTGRRRVGRRRNWLRWAIPLLAVVLIATGVWVVAFSSAFTVQHVRVTGVNELKQVSVRHAGQVPHKRPLARIDVDGIKQRVTDLKRVRSAKVKRSWPDTVQITVTERKPLYRMKHGDQTLLVDRKGVSFPPAAKSHKELPKASVDPDRTKLRSDLGTVMAAMPKSLRAKVRHVDASSRDTIQLKLPKGRKVLWGNATDSELKAKVTTGLLKRKASVYNVSAPGYPTTR